MVGIKKLTSLNHAHVGDIVMRRMTMVVMVIMRHYCCCFSITLTASHLIRTSSPFSFAAAESADTREFIFRIRNMFEWQVFALRPGRNLHVTCAELWGVGVGSSSGVGMCVSWGGLRLSPDNCWMAVTAVALWSSLWQSFASISVVKHARRTYNYVSDVLFGKILFAKFFHNP